VVKPELTSTTAVIASGLTSTLEVATTANGTDIGVNFLGVLQDASFGGTFSVNVAGAEYSRGMNLFD
jgi:hypothetical protein